MLLCEPHFASGSLYERIRIEERSFQGFLGRGDNFKMATTFDQELRKVSTTYIDFNIFFMERQSFVILSYFKVNF